MTEHLDRAWGDLSERVARLIRDADEVATSEFLGVFSQVIDAWEDKKNPGAASLPLLMSLAVQATHMTYERVRNRLRTCYHEAGHAVMAYLFAIPFYEVSVRINPNHKSLGHVLLAGDGPPTAGAWSAVDRIRVENVIICELAGPMAHDWGWAEEDRSSFDIHMKEARRLASQIQPGMDPATMEALLGFCLERTRNLLMMYWPGVESLAKELESREIITGDEAREILDRVIQRPPVGVAPDPSMALSTLEGASA